MKKIFLLAGLSLVYSVCAFSTSVGGTGVTNPSMNPGTGTNPNSGTNPSGTNTTPNTSPTPGTNPNPDMYNKDGIGNGGNTNGIGTDHGGGNGPTN